MTAWTRTRLRTSAVTAAVLVALPAGVAVAAPPPEVLPRSAHGEAAVRALGDRLPAVAAAHGRTPAALREQLRTDPTLWVDPTLRLFHVEPPAPATAASPAAPAPALAPLTDAFALHSRMGAQRTIYLDFDGHAVAGTAWNSAGPFQATAYSSDSDDTTFSDADTAEIRQVWQRIAEDYAPFDVDVTTEEPAAGVLERASSADSVYGTRLVVTPSSESSCGCGGIAYVGVFDATGSDHDYYQPAFVYTNGVGTGAKNIAEAGSHEVGHNLGLSHDGTRSTGYYQGQGSWAPIMGVGYYRPVSQWSKGEYSGANQREDDVSVMAAHGATLRGDDHGDTASATDLGAGAPTTGGGATWLASGVVTTASDADAFSLTTGAGTLSVSVSVADLGADLDARLEVRDAGGTLLASADPAVATVDAATATGLAAALTVAVPAGRYTVRVDGVGSGSPTGTGYSDYGSVGAFRLSASLAPGPVSGPPPAPASLSAVVSGVTVQLGWADVAGESGYGLVREKQAKGGTWAATALPSVGANVTSAADAPGAGTYRYKVRSLSGAGSSAVTTSATVTVGGGKPR